MTNFFAIHDNVKHESFQPFPSRDMKSAMLVTKQALDSGESIITLSPEDYSVIYVGSFDSKLCRFDYDEELYDSIKLDTFIKKVEVNENAETE